MEPIQPAIQQPVQNPVEFSIPQPKSNYLIMIISSILGIILLASMIFLYFQNQQLKKQFVSPQVSPTIQAPSPTPKTVSSISIAPDEMAEWKTYINSKYGFTVNYPPDFKIDDSNEIATIYKGEIINSPPVDPFSKAASISFSFRTSLSDATKACYENSGVMGVCAEFTNSNQSFHKNIVSFNNMTGISVQSDTDEARKLYYLKNLDRNNVVEVLLWNPNSIANIKLLDQILSTFKFLSEPSKCLTIVDPCNPQSCNYDLSKCIK